MDSLITFLNTTGKTFVDFSIPMLIQSSVLIIVLLALDLLLQKKVRAVFRYCIWMLVLVKLVLPTTLSSPTGLGYWFGDKLPGIVNKKPLVTEQTSPILPSLEHLSETVPPETGAAALPSTGITHEPIASIPAESAIAASPPPVSLSWQGFAFLGWLAVVFAMALLLVQRMFFVKGLLAQSKTPGDSMVDIFERCRKQMGPSKRTVLKLSPVAASPSVCGLLRPTILIPQNLPDKLKNEDLRSILLHELAHIKRGDLPVSLIQTILQIAYFYNPLLWVANAIIRKVREQAVDEMVLVAMGARAEDYPETLLNISRLTFSRPVLSLRLIGVVESKKALAGRIKHILSRPFPKTAKLSFVGVIAIIIAASILLPMAKAAPKPPEFIITGTVTDAETGLPIAGAKVGDVEQYAEGKQWTTTDSNGNYEYKTWYEEHNVKTEADGYKPQNKGFRTKLFGSEKKKVIDFALEAEENKASQSEVSEIPQEFVGHWKGKAKIIVNWTKQRWLPIDIKIKPNGEAIGQVGDAQLENAVLKLRDWLTRIFNPKSNWMIRGDLIGPIIKKENIKREYINLLFHDKLNADGNIIGGFHTSGRHIGNKKNMVMSGTEMKLERVSDEQIEGVDITPADFDIRLKEKRGLCNLVVSIQNKSEVTIPKIKLRFYRGNPQKNIDEANNDHSGWHEAGPIEPGKSWNERTRDFYLPDGQYKFHVILDYDNNVQEINEDNNQTALQVKISNGQIVDKSTAAPDTVAQQQLTRLVDFEITNQKFLQDDSIEITEILGSTDKIETGQTYTIKGKYKLSSHDEAMLHIYATNGQTRSEQGPIVKSGTGEFTRTFIYLKDGWLHLSFYSADGGSSFGNLYFAEKGSNQQVTDISRITSVAGTQKTKTGQSNSSDKNQKTQATDKETIVKKLKILKSQQQRVSIRDERRKALNSIKSQIEKIEIMYEEAENSILDKDPKTAKRVVTTLLIQVAEFSEEGPETVSLRIPLAGLKIANTLLPGQAKKQMNAYGITLEEIIKKVEGGLEPIVLLDVKEENSHVTISLE